MAKTIEDYKEWKYNTARIYSKKEHLVNAVWNEIYEIAERDGVANFLSDDEEDMIEIIGIMISEAT